MLLRDRGELVAHDAAQALVVVEDRGELVDARPQLVALGLELEPAEPRESAQRHLEDVARLHVAEVEHLVMSRALAAAESSDERISAMTSSMSRMATSRPSDEVQALLGLAPAEGGAAAYDLEAVLDEHLEQLAQAERARLARRRARRR